MIAILGYWVSARTQAMLSWFQRPGLCLSQLMAGRLSKRRENKFGLFFISYIISLTQVLLSVDRYKHPLFIIRKSRINVFLLSARMRIARRMAMMAIATNNSMRVKPLIVSENPQEIIEICIEIGIITPLNQSIYVYANSPIIIHQSRLNCNRFYGLI